MELISRALNALLASLAGHYWEAYRAPEPRPKFMHNHFAPLNFQYTSRSQQNSNVGSSQVQSSGANYYQSTLLPTTVCTKYQVRTAYSYCMQFCHIDILMHVDQWRPRQQNAWNIIVKLTNLCSIVRFLQSKHFLRVNSVGGYHKTQ